MFVISISFFLYVSTFVKLSFFNRRFVAIYQINSFKNQIFVLKPSSIYLIYPIKQILIIIIVYVLYFFDLYFISLLHENQLFLHENQRIFSQHIPRIYIYYKLIFYFDFDFYKIAPRLKKCIKLFSM